MLRTLLGIVAEKESVKTNNPKEGDLFKVISAYGKSFEIRYGFYEESDRYTRYAEPVEIYPNFITHPQYTDDGDPFVTEMQASCQYFDGRKDENSVCGDCTFYKGCEELIGICNCLARKFKGCLEVEI